MRRASAASTSLPPPARREPRSLADSGTERPRPCPRDPPSDPDVRGTEPHRELLHDAALIGRVDATFDRAVDAERADGVWAERGAPADAGPDVAGAVQELAVWLGATDVRVGRRVPRPWSGALRA